MFGNAWLDWHQLANVLMGSHVAAALPLSDCPLIKCSLYSFLNAIVHL